MLFEWNHLLEKNIPTFQWEDKAHILVNVTLKPDKFFECVGHMAAPGLCHIWSQPLSFTPLFEIIPEPWSLLCNDIIAEHRSECILYHNEQRSFLFSLSSQLYHNFFRVRFIFSAKSLFLLLVQQFVFVVSSSPLVETLHTGLIFVTSNCAQRVHPVNDQFERLCLFSNYKLTGHDSEGLSG